MVQLKNGDVNVGDKILWDQGSDKPRRLGVFESLYESKMNVRMISDNELYTVSFNELTKADAELVEKFFKNKTKQELLAEVERLQSTLAEHGINLVIEKK